MDTVIKKSIIKIKLFVNFIVMLISSFQAKNVIFI